MAREPLEPGSHGTIWFEYYSKPLPTIDASGRTVLKRVRLKETGEDKIKHSEIDWVTARVRLRLPTGEYKEMSRSGNTKGKAERALKRALDTRAVASASALVQPTWTVEQLANHWLEHRRLTGLARSQGALQPSSLRQIEVAVRTLILGDRKERVHGEWQAVRRGGGIPYLRLTECHHGAIESWLVGIESEGRSTRQARAILNQMFGLAVRDGAMPNNPMAFVAKSKREVKDTLGLGIASARLLRTLVTPEATRKSRNGRVPNADLAEIVDFALGTGCRIGEILAIRWCDLHLNARIPYVVVRGTVIESRKGLPAYRSPRRKSDSRHPETLERARQEWDEPDLTLFLPKAVAKMLHRRRKRVLASNGHSGPGDIVFASARGTALQPGNVRKRLREAVAGTPLEGTTPHALRKVVATVVERELGMESARHQMGHVDPSMTGRVYVTDSMMGPGAREALGQFFDPDWQPRKRSVAPRMRTGR